MDSNRVDMIRNGPGGDVVIFVSRATAHALAVLLHQVDDHPSAHLSPMLLPLMQMLDRKLIGYKGKKIG